MHVRQAERALARRCQALERQARKAAKQQLAQAQRQAQAVSQAARQQGYAEGILQAAHELAEALLHSQRLAAQLRQEVVDTARSVLREVLGQVEWIEALVGQWPVAGSCSGMPLQVLAPLHSKGEHARLLAALRRQWPGEVQVEYQQQSHYRLQLGEQALEFDPGQIEVQLSEQLLVRCEGLSRVDAQLDQAARETLANSLSHWLQVPDPVAGGNEDAH